MKSNEIRARLANQDFEAKQLKQIQEDIRLLHESVKDIAAFCKGYVSNERGKKDV